MTRQKPSSSFNFHIFAPITVKLYMCDKELALKSSICKYTLIITLSPICDRKYPVLYFDMLRLHFAIDPPQNRSGKPREAGDDILWP